MNNTQLIEALMRLSTCTDTDVDRNCIRMNCDLILGLLQPKPGKEKSERIKKLVSNYEELRHSLEKA